MEPTIYKPGTYKTPGVYKGAGGIYKGRGVYNDGAGGTIPEIEIEGRNYPVVKIGNLLIMAENLDAPGNLPIGGTPSYIINTAHAYYYLNDESTYGYNGRKYGLLYNGYSSTFINSIIPDGWRLPTKSDFQQIIDEIGAANGNKLKLDKYWPNVGDNETGFSAPPSSCTDTGSNWFYGETIFNLISSINSKISLFRINDNGQILYSQDGASLWISLSVRFCKDA